jgi:hypothetical protein
MPKQKPEKEKPEQYMTREDAEAAAAFVSGYLENHCDESTAVFVLLLRWYAYKATRDDAETVYIQLEEKVAAQIDGVDEAIRAELARRLEALRARRGK